MAGHLGCSIHVIDSMTSSEFSDWAAYFRVSPFGTARDDIHHARTAAAVANVGQAQLYSNRAIKQQKNFTVSDFVLKKKKTESQKLNELRRRLNFMVDNEKE